MEHKSFALTLTTSLFSYSMIALEQDYQYCIYINHIRFPMRHFSSSTQHSSNHTYHVMVDIHRPRLYSPICLQPSWVASLAKLGSLGKCLVCSWYLHHLVLYFRILSSERHIGPDLCLWYIILTTLTLSSPNISLFNINTTCQLHHLFNNSVRYQIYTTFTRNHKSSNDSKQSTYL